MNDSSYERVVRDVLKEYRINPDYIEKRGKVFKIASRGNTYGLKAIGVQEGYNLVRYIQFLYMKGYYRFVPVFPTSQGRYYVLRDKQLFYLMPWLPNDEFVDDQDKIRKMFRELARLHNVSAKEIDVNQEAATAHYENSRIKWEGELELLDQYMESCEQKWYMSPFESEFVQYYHEIRKAYEYALSTIEKWHKKMEDVEKVRTVLVHGNLSTNHFIFDEKGYGYFISMEKSQISSPFRDLLPFMVSSLKNYPRQSSDRVDWIFTYLKHYPLRTEEKMLLRSYLAHPGNFVRIIKQYHETRRANHERQMTKKLQKNYWLFKNIEFVVMKMEEIERKQQMNQQQ